MPALAEFLRQEIEKRFRWACLDDASPYAEQVARYLSTRDLRHLLQAVMRDLRQETGASHASLPSVTRLVAHLNDLRLIIQLGEAAAAQDAPFWLVLRGGRSVDPNPLEMVAAIDRRGVVSHFSALSFYQLTDLRARMHFLTIPRPSRRQQARLATSPQEEQRTRQPKPRIGTERFALRGVSFRSKDLDARLVFGERKEWTDDREFIRVFDLERSLIDTLTDPACNGGVRGLLQAWENAAERLDEVRLSDYLARFGRPALWRRAGALAAHFQLHRVAEQIRARLHELAPPVAPIPLVWEQTGGSLLMPWEVLVPWR